MIISIREVRRADIQLLAAEHNVRIVRFSDVEKWGAGRPQDTRPPVPASPALISYSPMMAGDQRPKGAVLSHENIISAASACCKQLGGEARGWPLEFLFQIFKFPFRHCPQHQ